MTEKSPGKIPQTKPILSKTGKRARRSNPESGVPVINRMIHKVMGLLPAGMSPRSKRIMVFSGILLLAVIALFVIGGFLALMTGLDDQILTIVAAEFIIVGAVTVAGVLFTIVQRGN